MNPLDDVARRPRGCAVMHQHWRGLVFLHWSFAPELLRPLVPPALKLDLYAGRAWVAVTPFRVARMRPAFLPPLPGWSDGYEINVRTYVRYPGDLPAVWFFSLDATNALAVWGARLAFHLPYFQARMDVDLRQQATTFRAHRTHPGAPAATLDAAWELGDALPKAQPGSLEHFLVERYVLYTGDAERLVRGRIAHRPWSLRAVRLTRLASTMLASLGLDPSGTPHVLGQARELRVAVWRPRAIDPKAL